MAFLSIVLSIISFVCFILIVIDAYRDEAWKGILGFFCLFYTVYYAVTEYDNDYKWLIILGMLSGILLKLWIIFSSMGAVVSGVTH